MAFLSTIDAVVSGIFGNGDGVISSKSARAAANTANGAMISDLEEQLAASGLRLTVGATLFDPTGRILVEDARLHLPAFSEPVVRIGARHGLATPLNAAMLALLLQVPQRG